MSQLDYSLHAVRLTAIGCTTAGQSATRPQLFSAAWWSRRRRAPWATTAVAVPHLSSHPALSSSPRRVPRPHRRSPLESWLHRSRSWVPPSLQSYSLTLSSSNFSSSYSYSSSCNSSSSNNNNNNSNSSSSNNNSNNNSAVLPPLWSTLGLVRRSVLCILPPTPSPSPSSTHNLILWLPRGTTTTWWSTQRCNLRPTYPMRRWCSNRFFPSVRWADSTL